VSGNWRTLVAVGLFLAPLAGNLHAEDHLAPSGVVQQQLTEAANDRELRIAEVDGLLDTPQAARVSRASGIGIPQLKRQVALLSDADLRELALRAEALNRDPVAGSAGSDWALATLLAIFLAPFVLGVGLRLLSGPL